MLLLLMQYPPPSFHTHTHTHLLQASSALLQTVHESFL